MIHVYIIEKRKKRKEENISFADIANALASPVKSAHAAINDSMTSFINESSKKNSYHRYKKSPNLNERFSHSFAKFLLQIAITTILSMPITIIFIKKAKVRFLNNFICSIIASIWINASVDEYKTKKKNKSAKDGLQKESRSPLLPVMYGIATGIAYSMMMHLLPTIIRICKFPISEFISLILKSFAMMFMAIFIYAKSAILSKDNKLNDLPAGSYKKKTKRNRDEKIVKDDSMTWSQWEDQKKKMKQPTQDYQYADSSNYSDIPQQPSIAAYSTPESGNANYYQCSGHFNDEPSNVEPSAPPLDDDLPPPYESEDQQNSSRGYFVGKYNSQKTTEVQNLIDL